MQHQKSAQSSKQKGVKPLLFYFNALLFAGKNCLNIASRATFYIRLLCQVKLQRHTCVDFKVSSYNQLW